VNPSLGCHLSEGAAFFLGYQRRKNLNTRMEL
jgi:hypothetical protein